MKTQDPITGHYGILGGRAVWFITIAAAIAIALWIALLTLWFHYSFDSHWPITQMAFDSNYPWVGAVFWLCTAVGVLFTTVVFLVIALRWRSRGGDLHHRGARFTDRRNGRDD